MSDWEAMLLGLVQGLTEFLPVSSSGHLLIAQTLLGRVAQGITFEVAVHLGTLGAILFHYRRRLAALLRGAVRAERAALDYLGKLALATLPAVLAGLLLRAPVEALFEQPVVAGFALLVTGALLFSTRRTLPGATLDAPGWRAAGLIGLAQALAIVPGLSRSGITVAVALMLGVRPLAAAEFSFLLGAIAIAGASLLELPELLTAEPAVLRACALGGGVALLAGFAALLLFVRLLRTHRFHLFAWYCFALGTTFLAWLTWARP